MSFDQEPDGDPHGECRDEIDGLKADIHKLLLALNLRTGAAPPSEVYARVEAEHGRSVADAWLTLAIRVPPR